MAWGSEFYEVNEEKGIVVSKALSDRAFVLGLKPWTFLVERLSERFGTGAQVLLYEMGKSYGQSLSYKERSEVDYAQGIKYLARKATIAGWGNVSVSTISTREIDVRIEDCVFCAGITDSKEKETPCYFIRGVISGMADSIYGSNKTVETRCTKEYCEFKVQLV